MLALRFVLLEVLLLRVFGLQKPALAQNLVRKEKGTAVNKPEDSFHIEARSGLPKPPTVKHWGHGIKPASSLISVGERAEDGSFYGQEFVSPSIREDSDLVNTMLEQQKKYPAWEVYAKQRPKHPQPGIPLDDPGRLFGVKSTIKEEQAAGMATCTSGGDPHVVVWDGINWDPMHAPGDWWVIKTADDSIQVQAQYSGAGRAANGGWQNTLITVNGKQVPRTANSAVAVSGNFIKSANGKKNSLVVKPPCEYYRDTQSCGKDPNDGFDTSSNSEWRMWWNGVRVKKVDYTDPKIKVETGSSYGIHAGASDQLYIRLDPWGDDWSGNGEHPMMNFHIDMKMPGCSVCGHCGNYNGQTDEVEKWAQWGTYLGTADAALCEADVACADRLIAPKSFGSFDPGTSKNCPEPAGAGFTLEECKQTPAYVPARTTCIASLNGIAFFDQASRFKALDKCMLDECVNQGFSKADLKDSVISDEEETLGMGAIEDVGEFENACEVDKVTNVMCDCRAAMPTEAPLICKVGETCTATVRDTHGQMGAQCKTR